MSKTEARKHTLWAAAQEAMAPTDRRGPWTLVLRASTTGAIVAYMPYGIHIPVRGLDERPDDRTQVAARIYAARPDLHAFLHLDELTRVLHQPRTVDIAEAWLTASRLAAYTQAGGNVQAAAARVGEKRPTLAGWLKRHGVKS
jgi:hypothetical protein